MRTFDMDNASLSLSDVDDPIFDDHSYTSRFLDPRFLLYNIVF